MLTNHGLQLADRIAVSSGFLIRCKRIIKYIERDPGLQKVQGFFLVLQIVFFDILGKMVM
jgi:hypothetical protein